MNNLDIHRRDTPVSAKEVSLENKIKCNICYKFYKKKYKTIHNKSQHHLICEQLINDIKFKSFETQNIDKTNNENNNLVEFIVSQTLQQ
jgi:NAD-dependent SIR2 family protein deacetylase